MIKLLYVDLALILEKRWLDGRKRNAVVDLSRVPAVRDGEGQTFSSQILWPLLQSMIN